MAIACGSLGGVGEIVFGFVRGLRVRTLLAVSFVGVGVLLDGASGAGAFVEPGFTGFWGDYANCPALMINGACVHSVTTGGVVEIGHSVVPISVPGDTFDMGIGGFEGEPQALCTAAGFAECAVAPQHGIMNGPAQPVPGSLLGTIGNVKLGAVAAKLEWAAPVPSNTPFGAVTACGANLLTTFDLCKILGGLSGTAITLSVKIHLLNPFLGSSCYIGSAASPIVIPLTLGTTSPPPPNVPIKGKIGTAQPLLSSLLLLGMALVNNSFSVPGATGCGTTGGGLVNASIDQKLGLPSAAGHNTIVVDANGEEEEAAMILKHGWTGE